MLGWRPIAQSAAGATAPMKRPWPRRNGPPRGSSACSSSPRRTASGVRRRPRVKPRKDRRALAHPGKAREGLVSARFKPPPDCLPSFLPLTAVSGAQLVRVRCSLRFEFRTFVIEPTRWTRLSPTPSRNRWRSSTARTPRTSKPDWQGPTLGWELNQPWASPDRGFGAPNANSSRKIRRPLETAARERKGSARSESSDEE